MPWRTMPQVFAKAVLSGSVVILNVFAWIKGADVGSILSVGSVLSLGTLAIIGEAARRGMGYWREIQIQRAQLELDIEKLQSSSLGVQIQRINDRLEDANQKLHKQQSDLAAERMAAELERKRHTQELEITMGLLTESNKQLGEMNARLAENNGRLKQQADETERLRVENAALTARLGSKVAANAEAIKDLQEQAASNSGILAITPIAPEGAP